MKIPGLGKFTWRQDEEGFLLGIIVFFALTIIPFTRSIVNQVVTVSRQFVDQYLPS
ncbi:MAG: hypothetical protein ACOCP4_07455 [Candidatus Woesearchaeota archaeon]